MSATGLTVGSRRRVNNGVSPFRADASEDIVGRISALVLALLEEVILQGIVGCQACLGIVVE